MTSKSSPSSFPSFFHGFYRLFLAFHRSLDVLLLFSADPRFVSFHVDSMEAIGVDGVEPGKESIFSDATVVGWT